MKNVIKNVACCLVASVMLSATAFAQFTDMPAGENGAVLQRAVDNGLLSGFEDNTVRPDGAITRAQMATIMVRALATDDVAGYSAKPGKGVVVISPSQIQFED